MRISGFLALSTLAFLALLPGRAEAKSWLDWVIAPPRVDYSRPYLEGGKASQISQWANDSWKPEDWVEAKGSKEAVIAGLVQANILRDDDLDSDELEVGYTFLRLADKEKIRVVRFADYVSNATAKSKNNAMLVEYDDGRWLTADIPVGVYTQQYGLQLQ